MTTAKGTLRGREKGRGGQGSQDQEGRVQERNQHCRGRGSGGLRNREGSAGSNGEKRLLAVVKILALESIRDRTQFGAQFSQLFSVAHRSSPIFVPPRGTRLHISILKLHTRVLVCMYRYLCMPFYADGNQYSLLKNASLSGHEIFFPLVWVLRYGDRIDFSTGGEGGDQAGG